MSIHSWRSCLKAIWGRSGPCGGWGWGVRDRGERVVSACGRFLMQAVIKWLVHHTCQTRPTADLPSNSTAMSAVHCPTRQDSSSMQPMHGVVITRVQATAGYCQHCRVTHQAVLLLQPLRSQLVHHDLVLTKDLVHVAAGGRTTQQIHVSGATTVLL